MPRVFIGFLVFIMASTSSLMGQTVEWSAILYDVTSYTLFFVDDEGIVEEITLPTAVWPAPDVPMDVLAVSPDGRYAVVKHYAEGGTFLVHLRDSQCCRQLALAASAEVIAARFSPDSALLAVNYFMLPPSPNPPYGLLAIVDVADNEIVASITSDRFGQTGGVATLAIEWVADGVSFFPNCWACEPALEGERFLWNPHTDTVTSAETYSALAGDFLPMQAVWIYGADNTRFAYSREPYGILPPYNVIVTRGAGMAEAESVIYHDPNNLNLPPPRWVADGHAFVMYHYNGAIARLVYRDGRTQDVPISADETFLTGTRDGWLAFHPQEGLVRYNAAGRQALSAQTPYRGPLVVLYSAALGATVVDDFAIIPTPPPLVCPGALPSRLAVGRYGRVTSGAPNNLRTHPSTSAALIGQLPAESFLAVLDGPICAEGYAWFQVDYQGTIGWTAEGNSANYWLEPSE